MNTLTKYILETGIYSGFIVLVILIIRFLFRKAPKTVICTLWGLVALRLLIIVPIESGFSLLPGFNLPGLIDNDSSSIGISSGTENKMPGHLTDGSDTKSTSVLKADTKNSAFNNEVNRILNSLGEPDSEMYYYSEHERGLNDLVFSEQFERLKYPLASEESPVTNADSNGNVMLVIIGIVWISGVSAMLMYGIIRNIAYKRKLKTAVRLKPYKDVFRTEYTKNAFVMGIANPTIYISYSLNRTQIRNVLLHEREHIRRKDNILKPFAYTLLAIYWFVPWAWLAYILYGRDTELACDEGVIKSMDVERRICYAYTLFECSRDKSRTDMGMVSFGEPDVEKRLKNIFGYRKKPFWISATAAVLALCSLVLFISPVSSSEASASGKVNPADNSMVSYDNPVDRADYEVDVVIGAESLYNLPFDLSELRRRSGMSIATYTAPDINNSSEFTEQLMMKLLAGDPDVDVFLMYLPDPVCQKLSDDGVAYPLDASEVIKTENEKLFENIRGKLKTPSGNIWGIPLRAINDILVTYPENMIKAGMSSEIFKDYFTMIDAFKKMNPEDRKNIVIWGIDYGTSLLENYFTNNRKIDYESSIFREYFEKMWSGWVMYENMGQANNPYFGATNSNYIRDENFLDEKVDIEKTIVFMCNSKEVLRYKKLNEGTRIYPKPLLSDNYDQDIGLSQVAVVNPNGKHRDNAVKLLETLAVQMREKGDLGIVFEDPADYPESIDTGAEAFKKIYDINRKAVITDYGLINDYLMNEIKGYQHGEIDLDTAIKSMQRKEKAYRNKKKH